MRQNRHLKKMLGFENWCIAVSSLFLIFIGLLPLIKLVSISIGLDDQYSNVGNFGLGLSDALRGSRGESILRSLVFASLVAVFQFAVSVAFSRFLFTKGGLGTSLSLLAIVPLSITPIASSLMWKALLDYQSGPLNALLELVGAPRIPWLSTLPIAFPPVYSGFSELNWGELSVLLADSWLWIPFLVGAQLVAFRRVPRSLLECAYLEGAKNGIIFWRIVIPLSSPYLILLLFLRFVDLYRGFDTVWAFFGEQAPIAHLSAGIYSAGYLARDYEVAGLLALAGAVVAMPATITLLEKIRRVLRQEINEVEL